VTAAEALAAARGAVTRDPALTALQRWVEEVLGADERYRIESDPLVSAVKGTVLLRICDERIPFPISLSPREALVVAAAILRILDEAEADR
jgi:hypothetical protein